MSKDYEMHVVSHAHWDREWRYSFAEFRLKLVDVMDRLLEILDSRPDYKHYHLDAQTSLVEDYLQIRPENRQRIARYVKEGRILVGPWYTLPEEFLISGESLVRNLLLGHQIASKLGKVMKVGYMPTSCGQISQLPQILAGFGIDTALFYRGINPHDADAEFIWEGADGTRALTSHFYVSGGRANFFSYAFMPVLHGGWKAPSFEDAKQFVHVMNQNYPYMHDHVDPPSKFHTEIVAPAMKHVKADALAKSTIRYLLYMDGCDNGGPHVFTADFIRHANRLSRNDRYIHSSLPKYIAKAKQAVSRLKVLTGEMRHAGKSTGNALYVGVLSARMYIKQLNARAEYNLAGRSEPWAVVARLLGEPYPKTALDLAWRYLLSNHAHDSMEACSTDPVHADMEYRFSQCNEMSLGLLRRNLGRIVAKMPLCKGKELSMTVFNSMASPRSEVVSAVVDVPDYDHQTTSTYTQAGKIKDINRDRTDDLKVETFTLYAGDRPVPCQITRREDRNILIERRELNTGMFRAKRFHFNFLAENIPAVGYKVFRIVPNKTGMDVGPSLARSPRTMENEYLRVKIKDNGSLTIKDKRTGRTFNNLHVFEDEGEIGDSLWHIVPENDRPITSSKSRATVKLEHADALKATYLVKIKMSLPISTAPDGKRRNSRKQTMEISSRITLSRGAKRVDIVTTLDNRIKDHRLRVLFPSGIKSNSSWAGGQFDVIRRAVKSTFRKGWADEQLSVHPQYYFADITDGKAGLAVLVEGLTEYEVIDDAKRTIAVTLIRAIDRICGTPARDDIGGQCIRAHEFRYSICPHAGDYQQANLVAEARRFNLPLEAVQSGRRGGRLGDEISFLSIDPATLILTGLKQSENGRSVIARFFNPLLTKVRGSVRCFRSIRQAWETNLNEQRQEKLKLKDKHTIALHVGPKKIVTLEIMLNKK